MKRILSCGLIMCLAAASVAAPASQPVKFKYLSADLNSPATVTKAEYICMKESLNLTVKMQGENYKPWAVQSVLITPTATKVLITVYMRRVSTGTPTAAKARDTLGGAAKRTLSITDPPNLVYDGDAPPCHRTIMCDGKVIATDTDHGFTTLYDKK